jgi:hypothetical protein
MGACNGVRLTLIYREPLRGPLFKVAGLKQSPYLYKNKCYDRKT